LSTDDNVVTGSFYPYDTNGEKGIVRVVVPNKDAKGNAALVGLGSSKFVSFNPVACLFHIMTKCQPFPIL
jgi:hypothetical protein